MAEPPATSCPVHETLHDDCFRCNALDRAIKAYFKNFKLPPSAHPSAIKPHVEEWIGSIFNTQQNEP